MLCTFEIGGLALEADIRRPIDISIPLRFNGDQPNAFGVARASAHPVEAGSMTGDTRLGGSCNFESVTFIPHCSGTHTECVGHITHERISVRSRLKDTLVPAALISARPEQLADQPDSYKSGSESGDLVISRQSVESALERLNTLGPVNALIVRTLPNDVSKLSREYLDVIPPYFTDQAIESIVGLGIRHLVVDLPSIDRMYDGGRLSNHRVFWGVEPGSFELGDVSRADATVTELAYIPDEAADGEYLLNLQIAPFESDAAPSRPLLFPLRRRD